MQVGCKSGEPTQNYGYVKRDSFGKPNYSNLYKAFPLLIYTIWPQAFITINFFMASFTSPHLIYEYT